MMSLNQLNAIFADATAPASTSPAAPAGNSAATSSQGSPLGFIVPMALMLVILYFLMIRPQSQQRKKLTQMLETIKAGDKIVTASGIVGQVITVKEKTISIRSADAKMEITKSSVAEILERDGAEKSAS